MRQPAPVRPDLWSLTVSAAIGAITAFAAGYLVADRLLRKILNV